MFLDVKFVHTQRDDESVTVGFADDPFNTSEYILLQRMLKPFQDGDHVQQEDVHIEINEQKYAACGGVRSIVLSAGVVVISLEPTIANKLCIDEHIEVSISKANPDFKELREALELLCKDVVQFTVGQQ